MPSEEKEVGPFIIKLTAQQVFADYTVQLEVKIETMLIFFPVL